MSATSAANQTEIEGESSRDTEFGNCFNHLKRSHRWNSVRRYSRVGSFAIALLLIGVSWVAWKQSEIAEQALSLAMEQRKIAEQQAQLNSLVLRKAVAISLWRGLEGWGLVPSSTYVNGLWNLVSSEHDVRTEFVRQIPAGNIGRQMGFRPQPIIRAIGLRWPEEARRIVSDKVKNAVATGIPDKNPLTAPGVACVVAALSDRLAGDTLERAKASFEAYLGQAWTRPREVWSKARVLACLGPELPREKRDAALNGIVQTVEKEAPGAEGFELMGVVAAAAMAAWERHAEDAPLNPDDLKASSAAIDAAIAGLEQADPPFMAISISRSLVSLIAALPGHDQLAALGKLLSAVNELPEANNDPDVLLILAQAFEHVTEQHASDERAKELQPLIDQAQQMLTATDTARDKVGIAPLVTPLAEGRTGILNQLLRVAGIEAAPADAADELLDALNEVGGKSSTAGSDPRELQADGLRIGLQGRLLALLFAKSTEARGNDRVDPLSTLSNAIDYVDRSDSGGQPALAESQQHFAREGLARAFAALAPSLDENQRETALATAKRALAITGSAEEAAAWATAIRNLLAGREDGAAVEEIVEVLKYPTAALTAREPNASEPRNATDILAQTLAQRLNLRPVEPLHPDDLQELLDSATDRVPELDLMKRPEQPPKLDGSASGPW